MTKRKSLSDTKTPTQFGIDQDFIFQESTAAPRTQNTPPRLNTAIQLAPIADGAPVVAREIQYILRTGAKSEAEIKALQEQYNTSNTAAVFIDRHNREYSHCLTPEMCAIIHALSILCFNEEENHKDKTTTARAKIKAYSEENKAVKKVNQEIQREWKKKGTAADITKLESNTQIANCTGRDLLSLPIEAQLFLLDTFKPKCKCDTPEQVEIKIKELQDDAMIVVFSLADMFENYLGIEKDNNNYSKYRKAFDAVRKADYVTFNGETSGTSTEAIINQARCIKTPNGKEYWFLSLSKLFWEGTICNYRRYPPMEIDKAIMQNAIGKTREHRRILYEYLISVIGNNWHGKTTFGDIAAIILRDDMSKPNWQPVRIKEKMNDAFDLMADNGIITSNPIKPLMKLQGLDKERLCKSSIKIVFNEDLFKDK